MSFLDGDLGNGVVVLDGDCNVVVNDNFLGMDVSIGFFSVDLDLVVSPFGELVKDDQKFSLEFLVVVLDIECELHVKVINFESQFSGEFNRDGVDFKSDSFFEHVDGEFGFFSNDLGGFSNGE